MFSLKNKQDGFTWHNLLVVTFVLAGVFIIGFIVKNQIEIQVERKQFFAAQKEVNALGKQIADATKPDRQQSIAYCDYGHVKYGRGGRTCWAKYYQLNLNVSKEDALSLMDDTESEMKKSIKYEVRNATNLISLKSLKWESNGIGCSTAIYYKEEGELGYNDGTLKWDVPDQSAITVTSCSGEAKAEYFSVKD